MITASRIASDDGGLDLERHGGVVDDLEPPVTPDHPGNGTFASTLIELQGNEPLISPPLVDEPITGVGNDDLWVPECKPGSQQEGCPQQDGAQ